MSLENEGSAQPQGDAGNPEGSTAAVATPGSSDGAATDLWAGLRDEGNRKTVDAKGWAAKGLDDVVSSYRELESRLGKALVPPGDDAKPEDWTAFYAKLGRPEKPEAYEFKLPEGLPENFPYDGKSAVEFKTWAHEAGLTPRQAQAVHDKYVGHTAATLQQHAEATAKAIEEAHGTLVKEWGDPTTETYKRNQELANRAIRQQGGSELLGELKRIGALGPNGEVMTPHLAKALAKTGQALYAEDTAFGGPSQGPNPFSEKSLNMTAQGQIIRTDPDHARALIRAAGDDPKKWGL
jgi:hypothetical protein